MKNIMKAILLLIFLLTMANGGDDGALTAVSPIYGTSIEGVDVMFSFQIFDFVDAPKKAIQGIN